MEQMTERLLAQMKTIQESWTLTKKNIAKINANQERMDIKIDDK
jgi:hypothetical protein